MESANYWLNLFTGTTWQEFLDAGANISGFRENRWSTVQRIKVGDYLLCYLTGVSRLIGLLEVTGAPFWDDTPIWNDALFPCRLRVQPLITLTPETAVPIHDLRDELSIFENLKNPNAWVIHVRSAPARWKRADGEAVREILTHAKANPVIRKVDKRQLSRRPPVLATDTGTVTIPEGDEPKATEQREAKKPEFSEHTEMQYLLLKLGSDMGFSIWVARNDRNRLYRERPLSELLKLENTLPLQFDEATTRTIEYIDVLWLRGNAIVAAFEIESTTSIYSGLLRMSDLVAMQPNLNIPLYLVAPEERREKVFEEVNRPTFARLTTPLADVCRYISFSIFKQKMSQVGAYVRYLKPDFLDELAEVCDLDEG